MLLYTGIYLCHIHLDICYGIAPTVLRRESEVGTLISYIRILTCWISLRTLCADAPSPDTKALDVIAGPFATFDARKVDTAMQKYIVPWSIALEGFSYAKRLSLDVDCNH